MRRMTLCPNCRTIQKAGTACSICKCPVEPESKPPKAELPSDKLTGEDFELEGRRHEAHLNQVYGHEEE